ncbi:RND transporter, partial [Azospirillum brasilense]
VKLLTVGTSSLHTHAEYAGEVRARIESRLGFRVAGKIVQRQAELGQRVQAGQVLAQIDPRDYQLSADAARAQVASAQTQRDLAAADYQRFSALKAQNFISGAELDRRSATLKAAEASLEQARAQAASQSNQTQYTRLVADAAGVVTGIDAEPGQVVAAGTPVVRIAQDGPRDVVFSVPEDRLARVRPGQAVTVRTWSGGGALPGRVREVAASAD